MKKIFIVIILIGFGLLISSLILFSKEIVISPEKSTASLAYLQLSQKIKELRESEIIIFAVGDIMLNRGVEYMIEKEGKGDFKFPFLKIAEDLQKPDILFGNLEGPISNKGRKVGSIYSFRMNPKVIEGLKYAGFDVLSLANNHMFDYERVALEDTMRILKESGIDYAGAGFDEEETFSAKIKRIKNTKVGFLAYTDLGPENWRVGEKKSGIAWIDEKNIKKIKEDIKNAKQRVDILFVSLHSGYEYSFDPTVFQVEFSKACIDAGADIVLGHHPHVIQKIEKFKDGWIVYSLGNFVFDQGFSEETMKGLLLEIRVIDGKIKEVNPREIKISQSFQPYFED